MDYRRRKKSLLDNIEDLRIDLKAEIYVLNEVRKLVTRNGRKSGFGATGSPKVSSDLCLVTFDKSLKQKYYDKCNSLESNIKKFQEDQAYVFNSILNEILLWIRVADPHSPITKLF